jgi:hypothetical protein
MPVCVREREWLRYSCILKPSYQEWDVSQSSSFFRRHQAVSFTNLGCASVRAIVRSPLVAHENAQSRIK